MYDENTTVQRWYEGDQFFVDLEEHNAGYMFVHFTMNENSVSALKNVRSKWEELKTHLKNKGWGEVYGYTRNDKINRMFPDWEYTGKFFHHPVTHERLDVVKWVSK